MFADVIRAATIRARLARATATAPRSQYASALERRAALNRLCDAYARYATAQPQTLVAQCVRSTRIDRATQTRVVMSRSTR